MLACAGVDGPQEVVEPETHLLGNYRIALWLRAARAREGGAGEDGVLARGAGSSALFAVADGVAEAQARLEEFAKNHPNAVSHYRIPKVDFELKLHIQLSKVSSESNAPWRLRWRWRRTASPGSSRRRTG